MDNLFSSNSIVQLLGIKIPIIQAGMIWCSGWELAAAVSEKGALGVIGSGSMYPEQLLQNIQTLKSKCNKPFAVNIPLLYADVNQHLNTIIKEEVPIVITSAGNPKTFTALLQSHGIKVIHVVSSSVFARKAEDAGVDAIVAEGFEAGGHNGREETTTMVLVPMVADAVNIPVIAAGGIGNGRQMAAALALGADAVQVGSRFVCSTESDAHQNFKQKILESKEGDTLLQLKKVVPVRLLKNKFADEIASLEGQGADAETLQKHLGRARAKLGMNQGNMEEGELEIGQVAAAIKNIKPAAEIIDDFINEYTRVIEKWRQ